MIFFEIIVLLTILSYSLSKAGPLILKTQKYTTSTLLMQKKFVLQDKQKNLFVWLILICFNISRL
jgi:hypothetical protein